MYLISHGPEHPISHEPPYRVVHRAELGHTTRVFMRWFALFSATIAIDFYTQAFPRLEAYFSLQGHSKSGMTHPPDAMCRHVIVVFVETLDKDLSQSTRAGSWFSNEMLPPQPFFFRTACGKVRDELGRA